MRKYILFFNILFSSSVIGQEHTHSEYFGDRQSGYFGDSESGHFGNEASGNFNKITTKKDIIDQNSKKVPIYLSIQPQDQKIKIDTPNKENK